MVSKADIRAEAGRLMGHFEARSARVVETDILQPADTLLDVYGEDIRARAYVTQDPLRGETMLRPDFTVPVAQMHLASGAKQAAYTYAGEIFRRQETDEARAREYVQVGYERFGGTDYAAEDAEVFAAIHEVLRPLNLRPIAGDIGIVAALIEDLDTPERRKKALRRHIWRPARFRSLLDRFSKPQTAPEPVTDQFVHVGMRTQAEIDARRRALKEEAMATPIPPGEISRIFAVLDIKGTLPGALEEIAKMAVSGSALAQALARAKARSAALIDLGLNPEAIDFEASYGRTNMEYYDGFVFGFSAPGQADLPSVATGGRYDMVTRFLGRQVGAVGAVIRPDLLLELRA